MAAVDGAHQLNDHDVLRAVHPKQVDMATGVGEGADSPETASTSSAIVSSFARSSR
uniref:hypothetical protein n=1 Tax=Paractinoplanes polyasparticus TaxID=2856853 RepID=UPI001C855A4E|nr:hypothetical protein [Actinoplanes polyasparticus]